jgi:hypothetical protein
VDHKGSAPKDPWGMQLRLPYWIVTLFLVGKVHGQIIEARKRRFGDHSRSEAQSERGGELHQAPQGDVPELTTAQGGPESDDQNSLMIGPRGPTVIEAYDFREKISTSTTRGFRSGSFTPAATARMVSSRITSRSRNPSAPICFSAPANGPQPLCDSRPPPAAKVFRSRARRPRLRGEALHSLPVRAL